MTTALPMKTVTTHEVDSYDLEKFVAAQYPAARDYSFPADVEASNGSTHRFVVGKEVLHSYDQGKLDKFVAGKFVDSVTRVLLTDLCNRDLIPAGTYLVRVSW